MHKWQGSIIHAQHVPKTTLHWPSGGVWHQILLLRTECVYLVTLSDAVENGIHWLWPLNSFWTYSVHIWRSYLKSLFIMVRISLKWPWRSKSISHILNSVRECPKIYILCKFGFPGSNSCWVIVWTTRIWQELIRLSPKRRWGSRSTDPIFKSGRCGRTILI